MCHCFSRMVFLLWCLYWKILQGRHAKIMNCQNKNILSTRHGRIGYFKHLLYSILAVVVVSFINYWTASNIKSKSFDTLQIFFAPHLFLFRHHKITKTFGEYRVYYDIRIGQFNNSGSPLIISQHFAKFRGIP